MSPWGSKGKEKREQNPILESSSRITRIQCIHIAFGMRIPKHFEKQSHKYVRLISCFLKGVSYWLKLYLPAWHLSEWCSPVWPLNITSPIQRALVYPICILGNWCGKLGPFIGPAVNQSRLPALEWGWGCPALGLQDVQGVPAVPLTLTCWDPSASLMSSIHN